MAAILPCAIGVGPALVCRARPAYSGAGQHRAVARPRRSTSDKSCVRFGLRPTGFGSLAHDTDPSSFGAAMKAWTALHKSWTTLLPARRWLLGLGLFVGVCLMTLHLQVLNEHMLRADQVRLGLRTAQDTLTATPSARR
jgi:hypothetical protein